MVDRPRYSDDDIDALVGYLLREEARTVDIERNYAAIQQRLAQDHAGGEGARTTGWRKAVRILSISRRRLAIAATVLLAIGLSWWATFPTPLSARAMITAAHENAVRADRCYRVKVEAPSSKRGRNFLLWPEWESLVWTRGDRFRATMRTPDKELVWGQDGNRSVWIVVNARTGLSFARSEVPPMLMGARAVLCLDVAQLTHRFLNDYDLEYQSPAADDGENAAVILATARPGNHKTSANLVHRARVVVDRDTKVIRRMQFMRANSPAQNGTLIFTLVDQGTQPDSSYELQGNLEPEADILDGRRSRKREVAFEKLLSDLGRNNRGAVKD